MTYAVVRFVAQRLTFLYNSCKSLVVRSVARRIVYFLIRYKCCVAVTPRILQLIFFLSLLAKIRALPFPFLFPLAKP
jgi:hypothetical protein